MPTARELIEIGNAHADRGQFSLGIHCYRQALLAEPGNAEAHNNLGIALYAHGDAAAAINAFRDALRANPNYANAYNNLGNALKGQGQLSEVVDCYRQALRLNPNHANAHNNLGLALFALGKYEEAANSFRQAVVLKPHYANAYNNLGQTLAALGQNADAQASYRRALAADPGNVPAHINLGHALADAGQMDEAAAFYRRALERDPTSAPAHNGLGTMLVSQGELDEAEMCYRRALAFDPKLADVYANLGTIYIWRGDTKSALESYEQALHIDPANKLSRFNRSMLRLLHGDFEGAWADYELRWTHLKKPRRELQVERWDGSALGGKTILIHAEQGFGDTIHFVRYLPLVKKCGGQVVFECQKQLLPLLDGIAGADRLVGRGEPTGPFDAHAPLLSLPAILHTNLATIPADVPYLRAREDRLAVWRDELKSVTGFKIGIAWQGSAGNVGDRYRSIPLGQFAKLGQLKGIRLISLQKEGSSQLATLGETVSVIDFGDRLDSSGAFLDTAAIMKHLDLIITADTAVAHLAGALGVPVWVVLSVVPDWRWLLDRDDSPWYPTMRLFRQSRPGDWDGVFRRVERELAVAVQATH